MKSTFDLWHLLEKYEVVVPVIQRDYAQGRKDKEYIRKTFLTEIKDYIDNRKVGTLDFVYGNIEGNRFYPLDGQQRLTTLWLIHWYISFKAGTLSEDKDYLTRFSYETRTSSREFCKALCCNMPNTISGSVVDYIKSQTWFYSSWLQDPTISGMLRTLGGDREDVDDNIEAILGDVDFSTYRELLLNQSIVNFELMVIGTEKLPVSDDLYIKMNARGKGLTEFENFKADLVAWIQSPQNPEACNYSQHISPNGISYRQYYPARIDNSWMDVFWNSAREKVGSAFSGRVDDIYFSFLNRYCLNEMCLKEDISPAEYAPGKEDEEHKEFKTGFDKLFGTGLRNSLADDSLTGYEGFDVYKPYITFEVLKKIDHILDVLSSENTRDIIDKALSIRDADAESVNPTSYTFIPRYTAYAEEQKLVSTSQKERVYFLAISLFVENTPGTSVSGFDEVKYNKWMRVVRNLVENAAIDNVPAMVTCMRLIKKLAGQLKLYDNDAYKTIKAYSEPFSNSQLEKQLKEEKEKAEIILKDENWETKIAEAEKYAFFNGTIRFLYTNAAGAAWDEFDDKFRKAKELFKDNTVPTSTVALFLKQFSSFEDIRDKYLFTSVGYHTRNKCWKKDILCNDNPDIVQKVHALLTDSPSPTMNPDYQSFIDSGLIEWIVSKKENYKYRYHWYYYWAVHKEYSQMEGVYVSTDRKAKCEAMKKLVDAATITLTDPIFNTYFGGYFWGIRLSFEYKGSQYNWYDSLESGGRVDKIYKVENDVESKNAMRWENAYDLASSLDAFHSWN